MIIVVIVIVDVIIIITIIIAIIIIISSLVQIQLCSWQTSQKTPSYRHLKRRSVADLGRRRVD